MPSGSNRISRTATASYAETNAVQYNHPIEHSWHETQESRERTRLARCREPLALPRNTYLITSICATRATGRGGYDTVVLLQQRRGGGRGRSMIQPNSCKGCVVGRYSARERSFRCSTSANLLVTRRSFCGAQGPRLLPAGRHGHSMVFISVSKSTKSTQALLSRVSPFLALPVLGCADGTSLHSFIW